jgi:predicted esterase
MIGHPFRAAICALLLAAASAPAQNPAPEATLVTYRVKPSSLDSTVTRFDEAHIITFSRTAKADAPLLLFLPGTGGRPQNATLFQEAAARQGYRVVGLQYVDEPAVQQVCPREPDPTCSEKVRRKRIFGDDVTPLIDDRAQESIVARLVTLLSGLERQHPGEGWAGYLKDGHPNWPRIAVSGHSQGAGMAAYIAQRTLVARVVLFSSPWDSYGPRRTLAPWLNRGNGATPPDRWYAAYHKKENAADLIERAYSALKIPRDHIQPMNLETMAAPNAANPYHLSVVGNGATPKKADGTPAYLDVWLAMVGDAR